MGTLKLEIDIPDFKNEINLNITLKKDGEVISSISADNIDQSTSKSSSIKKQAKKTTSNGNLMNIDY